MSNNSNSTITTLVPLLILGFASILVFQFFFDQDKPEEPTASSETVAMEPGMGQIDSQPQEVSEPSDSPRGEEPREVAEVAPADFGFVTDGDEIETQIITDNFVAVMSNRGGRVKSLYLRSTPEITLPERIIDEYEDPLGIQYQAIELTMGNGIDFQPHLYYWDNRLGVIQIQSPPLNDAIFTTSGVESDATSGQQEIRYYSEIEFRGHRLELVKLYRFNKEGGYLRHTTAIRNLEDQPFRLGGDLFFKPFGDIGPQPEDKDNRALINFLRFFYYNNSLEQYPTWMDSGGGMNCMFGAGCGSSRQPGPFTIMRGQPGSLEFMGSTSRYFFHYAKFLSYSEITPERPDGIIKVNQLDPEGRRTASAFFSDFSLRESEGGELDLGSVRANYNSLGQALTASEGNSGRMREVMTRGDALVIDTLVFYGVRRDQSHLFVNEELARAEFGFTDPDANVRKIIYTSGFFAIFSKIQDFIIWVMRHLYSVIGNYGWAIIMIAVGFKVLTGPLNQMQVRTMKKMQALKPEIEKINERFKDNGPEKQKAMSALTRKHKVNPVAGCLPMLIQIPVFIALYSAFSESVELWRSPFIFWMQDLSRPDTIFILDLYVISNFNINILPLAMASSQILQMKMTTVAVDKNQKMIMYFMPLIMLLFFWNMPSGVTLYWTVQNIVTVIWTHTANRIEARRNAALTA